MKNRNILSFIKSLAIGLLFLSMMLAGQAATIAWTNTAGGVWSVASNWNPHQVPGLSDDVLITSNGNYSVTVDSAVDRQ